MKVVQIVRQYRPMIGGLEESVEKLALALSRDHGIDVRIVTLDRAFRDPETRLPPAERIDGLAIDRIPWRGSSRYPIAPGVLRHIRDADLVHVHAIDFFFDFLAVTRAVHRKPLVASTHGGFFHTEFAGTLKKLWFTGITRLNARAYQTILASSANDGAAFSAIAGARVQVVENGVDIDKWRDAAAPQPNRTIISIGRFSVNKGLPDLIATLAALRTVDTDWRLILIGQESDLTADMLRGHAADLGVADAVDIQVGLGSAAIREVIGRASWFASASRFEGFGLAAVEGMSAGLIPLLSPIPPYRKLLAGGEAGAIVDFADPVAAATQIAQLHQAGEPALGRQRAGAMAVAERYAWPAVAARVAQIYRDILAR